MNDIVVRLLRRRLRVPRLRQRLRAGGRHERPAAPTAGTKRSEVKARSAGRSHNRRSDPANSE